ncbi:acyl-CoA dehydrogenase family protein [Gulosibacter bifidus]|uniref:Acyl-CoA dehydrogenase family protein n=1 Tax=Gulosibacter bifidus TaxID=272239 RepID=A0ABW5RFT4_9MICO|nr:acyl-CoA dehydrogenase family protein [Gulosibacter bifidus]
MATSVFHPLDLSDDLLEAFRARAAEHDRENSFPVADLEDLQRIGYLRQFVPAELGGSGHGLREVVHQQARLAAAAPATALAVNMHLITGGVARVLAERGAPTLGPNDNDLVWQHIADDAVIALGISEPGNDAVLLDSTVSAVPDGAGGYRLTGTKIFTSLSPVWTHLWCFGRDDSGDTPMLVHALIERGDAGVTIKDDWDTLGMRGTQSCSTTFNDVHVPASRILGTAPVGPSSSPIIFGIFSNFLTLLGACYLGIAERATELAVAAAHKRTSRVAERSSFAEDGGVREIIAQMGNRQLAARMQLESVAQDIDALENYGAEWPVRLSAAKYAATAAARANVQAALEIVGGGGFRRGHELERLYRDVAASVFHPSQDRKVMAAIASWLLDA